MLSIGLGHYLTLAAIIFIIGIVGIFLKLDKWFKAPSHPIWSKDLDIT